jgi:ABC-type antimicrobial peptide transport system permease subunit
MEVVYFIAVVIGLVGGVLGGLFGSWTSYRFQLALDQRQKTMEASFDDRLNTLQKMVTRQDKSAAVTARFSKAKTDDEKLATELTSVPALASMHPWDPRLWGKSG